MEKYPNDGPTVININSILKIFNKLNYGGFRYIRFEAYGASGLKLTDTIVNDVGLEDFSYLIDINNPVDLGNVEITYLAPFSITPFDSCSDRIISFVHNNKFISISTNVTDFINGNFDRRYPVFISYNSLDYINSHLDFIKSHPVIVEIIGDNKQLYEMANQLFVNGDILALILFIDGNSCIKYKNKEYFDRDNFTIYLRKIVLENRIYCSVKSANKRIN